MQAWRQTIGYGKVLSTHVMKLNQKSNKVLLSPTYQNTKVLKSIIDAQNKEPRKNSGRNEYRSQNMESKPLLHII